MYQYLEGDVAGLTPTRLVLDVGGVGYDLCVPLGSDFPASGRARAWTHLIVREDSHQLFGFADRETRDLFRLLLSVRGVGPQMALGILSGLSRGPLLEAIVGGDTAQLTRVKGVGRKTAEQILLDLSDKAAGLHAQLGAAPTPASDELKANLEDAVTALVSVGYKEKEARRQVERAAESVDAGDLELLVRTALRG
ncbi:MAG: Holliday junction branch migration protein RuvA [Planctomycetes bacterium]|nr:Holliday junction branch migration protein RuvA [Planctomycetota bacterium]MDP6409135.1 Holliday junction branch migration protein RuvA [Planctomycetota bacterium]